MREITSDAGNPSAKAHPFLRGVMSAAHRILARHEPLAKFYVLSVGKVLRALPRFPLRRQLVNNISSTDWPDIKLPAVEVILADEVRIKIVPHPGEFDFEAMFERELSYERETFRLLKTRLLRYSSVIEIGANVGVFTAFLAVEAAAAGHELSVYCFEPSRRAFIRLLENLAANGADGVHAFNLAVSDRTGFVSFFEPLGHLTNGSLSADFAGIFSKDVRPATVGTVDADALASLMPKTGSALIKMDVEGAEARVLKGLQSLIENMRPDLIIEVLAGFEHELNQLSFLSALYDFFLIEGGLSPRDKFVADPRYRDYLLVPKANCLASTQSVPVQ